MSIHRYFLSDFVSVQRQSFFDLLEKGLIEECAKRNPISSKNKNHSFLFYPEYYILTSPQYKPHEAILKNKSYTSKLFVPVQITDRKNRKVTLRWVYIGNIPLMTKRGHFILNGAARVIVNQILRSPGIYYQEKVYENYEDISKIKSKIPKENPLSQKEEKMALQPENLFKRYYCDLICMRGSWLRIEMDKEKNIWAQMKKGPKIPIYWFLLAMGLSEKVIIKSIPDSFKLLGNLEKKQVKPVRVFEKNAESQQNEVLLTEKKKKNSQESNSTLQTLSTLPLFSENAEGSSNPYKDNNSIDNMLFGGVALPRLSAQAQSKKNEQKSTEMTILPEFEELKTLKNNVFSTSKKESILGEENLEKNYNFKMNQTDSFNPSIEKPSPPYRPLGHKTSYPGDSKASPSTESSKTKKQTFPYLKNPPEAWQAIYKLLHSKTKTINASEKKENIDSKDNTKVIIGFEEGETQKTKVPSTIEKTKFSRYSPFPVETGTEEFSSKKPKVSELGRQWLYNRFMNPRSYDLGKQGRVAFNKKLGLTIASDQLTLTGLDVLYATDYLLKVEKGIHNTDDIDHLKNRRVRTSGELIQIQIGIGLVRLEKFMRYSDSSTQALRQDLSKKVMAPSLNLKKDSTPNDTNTIKRLAPKKNLTLLSSINNKAFNSAIREFFGTSPLSQFMDQINPLAELTHKRRLSSMGPGGVTRDTATLAIRGIHPTHYGRICPIETPEGKNTGLVNSMTTYARVNSVGILESPFYKVYKGQVQRNSGMYYLNAEEEEEIKLAAADLSVSSIGFLPKAMIPVRIAERFTKITRSSVQYIGVSPLQMISIAASLIPFLEHDDANRALMGSNMQRQAVPLIRPERPIVGTGLEARAVSDSGHVIQAQHSGIVTYVSAKKIIIS